MVISRFNDPKQISKKIRRVDHNSVDGNLFIEVLLAGLKLRTAAELARSLPVAPAILSRIRAGRAVSDELLVKLNIVFGLSISGLKDLQCSCSRSNTPVSVESINALAELPVFTQSFIDE